MLTDQRARNQARKIRRSKLLRSTETIRHAEGDEALAAERLIQGMRVVFPEPDELNSLFTTHHIKAREVNGWEVMSAFVEAYSAIAAKQNRILGTRISAAELRPTIEHVFKAALARLAGVVADTPRCAAIPGACVSAWLVHPFDREYRVMPREDIDRCYSSAAALYMPAPAREAIEPLTGEQLSAIRSAVAPVLEQFDNSEIEPF